MKCLTFRGLLLLSALGLRAATLYSVGPDQAGVPRMFTSISESGAESALFGLGDGSLGFNGGLAYHPGSSLFYGIANDFEVNSSLVSFSAGGGGTFTSIGPLGQGFLSGLAYSSAANQLYGISTDGDGNSTLNLISLAGAVTPVGSLGLGYYGGLAFNSSDGLLYAFSSASSGVPCALQSIDPATAAATPVFDLCDTALAFNGGVAYNPQGGFFFVISNDGFGPSMLQSFTLAGPGSLTSIDDIGYGFVNAGLALVETPVPEPSLWGPISVFLAGLLVRLRSRRR